MVLLLVVVRVQNYLTDATLITALAVLPGVLVLNLAVASALTLAMSLGLTCTARCSAPRLS